MKEYTLDDFCMKSVEDESVGYWKNDGENPDRGRFDVNYSSILTALIQTAGRVCRRYASDLFIDWLGIDKALEHREYEGGKYLFGFREDGVDHAAFVLSRLNAYGKEHFGAEMKELFLLEITVEGEDKARLRMRLGKAELKEEED